MRAGQSDWVWDARPRAEGLGKERGRLEEFELCSAFHSGWVGRIGMERLGGAWRVEWGMAVATRSSGVQLLQTSSIQKMLLTPKAILNPNPIHS